MGPSYSSPVSAFIAESVVVKAVFAVFLTAWMAVIGAAAVLLTEVSAMVAVPLTADCAVPVTALTVLVPRSEPCCGQCAHLFAAYILPVHRNKPIIITINFAVIFTP
jgi:hypothetical protein